MSFATSGTTVAMAAITISPGTGCSNGLSIPSVWPSSYLACSTSSDVLKRTAAVFPKCRASALQKRDVITSARRQACIYRDSLRFYSNLGRRGDVSGLSLGLMRGRRGRGSQFLVAASEEEKSGSGIVSVEDGEESSLSGSVAVADSEEDITESVTVEDAQLSTTGSGDDPWGRQLRESSSDDDVSGLNSWLYPGKDELPDDKEMTIFDHLEELRDRVLVSVAAVGVAILGCFFFAKELIVLLEAPVYAQGVRFLQLSPGEYFFTTLKVAGYCGLLVGSPVILYEITAFVIPGLTRSEKKFLGPIVISSSVLFFAGIVFSYKVLTPAALNFFVSYSEGAVESLWSIDKYFEFVLVLLFSTGLSFQVPVIQLLLGQSRLVTSEQMLSAWRYVVVGAVIAAAILTPSTDPLTQILLAAPLIGLYLGGALLVKFLVTEQEPVA